MLPSLDALLEELTDLSRHQKKIEARRQELLDALDQLVEDGEAEEKLSWNDFTIYRQQRTSYRFPPELVARKEHLKKLQEQLKADENLAIALGDAKAEQEPTRFWTVRQPKT